MSSKAEKNRNQFGVAIAQEESVQKHGAAIAEHLFAYTGVNNRTKDNMSKGLIQIADSKLNPDYRDANIKQQAGFSAEVKTAARENAEKRLQGNYTNHTVRTDDMNRQVDGRGHSVGGVNEQLYDIAEIDSNGVYVEGSARQLKFVGASPKECTQKLLGKKYDKYREADVPIEIASDFYDEAQAELTLKAEKLNRQIRAAEEKGNTPLADKHREQLDRVTKTKQSLRKGKLSNKEAIEARLHPTLSTAKDMIKLSHNAGAQGAKIGAEVGGGISLIHNLVAVARGDESVEDAVTSVVKDTAMSTATGYTVGFVGSGVSGLMYSTSSEILQSLSQTNLPAMIASTAMGVSKTLYRFGSGEIDATECLVELGETGTGMLASSAGAVVGQMIIPIPVVGGLVGGMVGYAMSCAYYNNLVSCLKSAKLAREERTIIEAECRESIVAMQEYRVQMELAITNYFRESMAAFHTAFARMEEAHCLGDADMFISGANLITRQLGGEPLFESKDEFDDKMAVDEGFII